ncbi:MAG: hypothetical protein WDO19_10295 [Bacteroidota bacterium]
MKKILTLSVLSFLFSVSILHAQISKGSLFLGGNISGSTVKTESTSPNATSKQNGLAISPVVGFAVKENLVFGADVGYSFFKTDQVYSPSIQKQYSYEVGVFLRKYKPIGKGFYLFLQGHLGGRYDETKYSPGTGTNNTKRFTTTFSGYPGVSYAVNRKLQLETGFNSLLSLNYYHETGENLNSGYSYKSNGFNIATSLDNLSALYIGFRLLIGK